MKSYNASNVINGTYGEVWLDDVYMAQATGLEAKTSVKKTDVNMVRRLSPGKKVTGIENKGTLRVPLFALASYRWDEEGAFYCEPEPLIFGDCLYPKSILKNVQCDHAYVVSVLASKVRR